MTSLNALSDNVNGWWEREGQLPVNIFNSFLHGVEKSLTLAQVCIDRFDLDRRYPPKGRGHRHGFFSNHTFVRSVGGR